MKLRAIELNNVRRFTAPVRIDGIGDGLNVLSEPNEYGKSTLFDALQALFFKPHGSRDRDIASLRPHAGGAPEISVTIETDDGTFEIAKRWFSKPAATVTRNGTLIAQADQAEDWIAGLLGGGAGDPSGLVWVRQGQTGLTPGTRKEADSALEARRDLMSSVTGEVEAMTGGRRMDAALARCQEELRDYATATGKPRTGGPWKDAQDAVDALEALHAELSATAEALHDALDQRKRKRRELAEFEDPDAVEDRRARLEAAQEAQRAADRHAEDIETAARTAETARLALTAAQGQLDRLRAARAELTEAEGHHRQADSAARDAKAAHDSAGDTGRMAQETLAAALVAEKAADADLRTATRQKAARDGAARRRELAERIEKAGAARGAMDKAEATARTGPDDKALQRLETLAAALSLARSARDAQAPQLTLNYAPGRDGSVTRDGAPLPGGAGIALPEPVTLELDGIGSLVIVPGGDGDAGAVDAADRALADALDAAGQDSLDTARNAAATRAAAIRDYRDAKATFEALAPDGIPALQAAHDAIPEPDSARDLPDPDAAETALARATDARIAAQAARDAAADRLSDARAEATRADTALSAAADRLQRARQALAAAGDTPEEALADALARARADLTLAEDDLARKRAAAPDPAAAGAALRRARDVDAQARAAIARLRPEIATLDERIATGSGNAVEERLAACAGELTAARAHLARIDREVAVLQRLAAALDIARTEARERYFAPVAAELKPLLHLLWPEAELTWGHETLLPDSLIRAGQEEPLDILSGGTREQIALLVRLAFARLLARGGRPAPVILDDALVYTDDDRIERMFDALHRQAGEMQILVLTCRQRAFRNLGGQELSLVPAG